jgi:RimJ/RimL family protein N-acetyltransferase
MIELQPFGRPDFARLIGWSVSAEFLLQWAGPAFTHPLDEAQLEKYCRQAEGPEPACRIFKAVEQPGGAVVGHVELAGIDRRHRFGRLSRALVGDPACRGRGVGLQIVERLLDVAFGELALHRVELYVFDFNEAAIRCYRKAGFVTEGRLREARRIGTDYWSLDVMSILEPEWAARRRPAR